MALNIDELKRTEQLVKAVGSNQKAAAELGLSRRTVDKRMDRIAIMKAQGDWPEEKPFQADDVPDELPSAEELLEQRKKRFSKLDTAKKAKKLINVKVKDDGPIGIVHFGDPHVDDDGTDIGLIEQHVRIVNQTPGLFGANVGDNQNNWVGRLARLYGEQSTSAAEAWVLTEWLVSSVNWLYILGGNHDAWSGAGDPLKWVLRGQQGVYQNYGARLNLQFPNKKQVRINARHDFHGHSMWNEVHGPKKAAKMGWRDHLLTCGHKHTSGVAVDKCPSTGLISHIIRVAGYKVHDRYAEELGLPDQNIFPACVTIIDPKYMDNDPRLVTTIMDVEEGADYLTWKRSCGK